MTEIGLTKRMILLSCVQRKTWTEIKAVINKSDPTLMIHLQDLVRLKLLAKNEYGYITTARGSQAIVREVDILQNYHGLLRQMATDIRMIKQKLRIRDVADNQT